MFIDMFRPTMVLDDVLEDKMTIEHARNVYGVVIGGGLAFALEVDIVRTAGLRARQPKTK